MRTVRRVLAIVAVPIVVIAAVALVRLDGRVRAYLAGPALGAVRIYAAPTMLRRDTPVPGGSLARKLARLDTARPRAARWRRVRIEWRGGAAGPPPPPPPPPGARRRARAAPPRPGAAPA